MKFKIRLGVIFSAQCIATLFVLTTPVQAQKSDKCGFEITCKAEDKEFSLQISSPSKDCSNDDNIIIFRNKKISQQLKVSAAWYYDIDNVGNEVSFCKSSSYSEYPLFILDSKSALIILRTNNRPDSDAITAVLIDITTGQVLDQKILGVSTRNSTGLLKSNSDFLIPLREKNIKEMRCDCDAGDIERWMKISNINGKIRSDWISDSDLNKSLKVLGRSDKKKCANDCKKMAEEKQFKKGVSLEDCQKRMCKAQ